MKPTQRKLNRKRISTRIKETLFRSRFFDLQRLNLSIGKRRAVFYRVKSSNSVVILPILDDGRVILERQYRPAIGRYLYEIPAGHMDDGESPINTARRELEEETGYRAAKLKPLFSAYPSPGIRTEFSSFYVASSLRKTSTHMDADEVIEIRKIKLSRLVDMIRKNSIIDAKTIAAVLFYISFAEKSPQANSTGFKQRKFSF